jgi:GxxExxY protein
MPTIAYDSQTYDIIGCAMDVHREKGCGFLERVYQQCMAIELRARNVPFKQQVTLPITYKGLTLSSRYCVDFICYGEVLVELKALASLTPADDAQVINYLRASDLERAVLLNFGARSLQYKRLVWTKTK